VLSETSNSTAEVALSTEQRLLSVIAERDATIEAQRVLIVQLRADFELLTRQVKQLLASRGSGHSIAEGQLTFFGAKPSEEEAPDAEPQPEYVSEAPDGETPDDSIKRRNKPKRLAKKLDVSALPRETVTHELPESERVCPATGVELVPVGVKVSEEIEYSAAQIRVIEHRRIKYGPAPEVAKERQIDLLITPLPPQVLEGCRAGPRLLAQIVVQKYMHHLPLYRQEEVFQQAGLWIPRQTLCDWVLGTAFQLRPIADELMRQIRAGPVFQLDDTPIKCRGPKGSGYFQAYLWTFANPEVSGVAFRFTPGRAAKLIEPMLEDFNGYLVGDGYSGHFAAAREAGGDIVHGGCFAHVLRKFRDAEMESRRMARLYMSDISALYDIEDEATEARLSLEERVLLRRKKARSVLARMLRRTRGWKDLYSTSGKMGEAIKYLLNQWSRLKCFLRDGLVPLDNNACERAIRPIAVGRRNWLFAGSERGGEAAAICYSVIGSCRAAGVDPFEYLADVLIKVATYPASQIADLVPARWAELRAESGEA
jgi:transposase